MSEKTNYIFTNLFISLYDEKNKERFDELHTCLKNNVKSGCFDWVYIIAENDNNGTVNYINNYDIDFEKVNILPCTTKPTFETFFNVINKITAKDDYNVIANADIYFEELAVLPKYNQCFALTRYETKRNGPTTFLNRSDSQDVWIFFSHIKMPKYCSFTIRPGADNRIARELSLVGYEMLNPSLTIKTFHLHEGQKSYTNETRKVGTPYLRLQPISI